MFLFFRTYVRIIYVYVQHIYLLQEFGAHFEIYEQHCQLETLNIHSLKHARENPQFTAYLEVRTYNRNTTQNYVILFM